MKQASRPPRLARWLLQRSLPADVREDIPGDLEEMFTRRAGSGGVARARLWYLRQVVSFAGRFLAERLRERRRSMDVGTGISGMDFKLACRMLVRYPGLTLVGVLGMAVGIAIAAGAFGIINTFTNPALPVDEGDRVITVHNVNTVTSRPDRRVLHDFPAWRDEVKSLVDVGAYRQVGRNLIAAGAQAETLRVAEMSAAGFRVMRVPALMGRHLLEEDERDSAPPVVVIGHELWQSRLGGDPAILSRSLQLGPTTYSIVGVMPEGFGFPISHRLWVPLRLNPSRYERLAGPELTVFGRLASGATLESAQAELDMFGARAAALYPATHEKLRPRVLPFTYPFFDINDPRTAGLFRMVQFLMSILLIVVSVNVAILVYARTATRQGEIAVRSALGASRRRIVAQLFIEALVLSGVAALAGLGITAFGFDRINAAMVEAFPQVPFWWTFRLSAGAVLYVLVLMVVAAAIVGAVPALKATGRRVQTRLQSLSAGGGSGMQLGKMWTVLIVAQVGLAVALLPAAVYHAWDSFQYGTADPGFPANEFLTSQLVLDRAGESAHAPDAAEAAFKARYALRQQDVVRRLEAEPVVADVTFGAALPGEEPTVWIEVAGLAMPTEEVDYRVDAGTSLGHQVRAGRVAANFFEIFEVPVLIGRTLQPADAAPAATAVVVNRTFVEQILGGGPALGQRLRYVGRSGDASPEHVEFGRWHEIVGVLTDFPARPMESGLVPAKLFHAEDPAFLYPSYISIRLRGTTPETFAGRFREIAAAVDPNLQLRSLSNMDVALRSSQGMMRLVAIGLVLFTVCVLVLSAGGIYALMSFTVSRRRKEIGIRAALGADAGRILRSIFSRAFAQLAAGAAAGIAGAIALERATAGGLMNGNGAVILPLIATFMIVIGLLAAVGPARRGLRIQPTEALRE